jgi:hypothetical protein
MFRLVLSCFWLAIMFSTTVRAEPPAKGIKAVTAAFEPAEAKPGQTVTLKLTIELEPGFTLYATTQTDKNAADFVTTIPFPAAATVVFVGGVKEPEKPILKAIPELGIKELRAFGGKVVFERPAVVVPTTSTGLAAVKIAGLKLQVCDEKNCYPTKALAPEAALKVLPGPAVAVEKQYKDEVEKALKK